MRETCDNPWGERYIIQWNNEYTNLGSVFCSVSSSLPARETCDNPWGERYIIQWNNEYTNLGSVFCSVSSSLPVRETCDNPWGERYIIQWNNEYTNLGSVFCSVSSSLPATETCDNPRGRDILYSGIMNIQTWEVSSVVYLLVYQRKKPVIIPGARYIIQWNNEYTNLGSVFCSVSSSLPAKETCDNPRGEIYYTVE